MITVKDAVKSAGQFVSELFPEAKNLRLEQVENGGPTWRVVMSFYLGEPSSFAVAMGTGQQRLFKEVDVDAATGVGTALRMWKL
jgi:hypothetical protein